MAVDTGFHLHLQDLLEYVGGPDVAVAGGALDLVLGMAEEDEVRQLVEGFSGTMMVSFFISAWQSMHFLAAGKPARSALADFSWQ